MSARSTQININNTTNDLLVLTGSNLDHGVWDGGPVTEVTPGQNCCVGQNDSDGMMAGDQGSMQYTVIGISNSVPCVLGQVNISWDNPYAGDNSYSCSAPQGMSISYSGGTGDNASVLYRLMVGQD